MNMLWGAEKSDFTDDVLRIIKIVDLEGTAGTIGCRCCPADIQQS